MSRQAEKQKNQGVYTEELSLSYYVYAPWKNDGMQIKAQASSGSCGISTSLRRPE
jgi:hypothetical protein